MTTVTLSKNGAYWQARWTDRRGIHRGKGLGRTDQVSKRAAMKKVRRIQSDFDANKAVAEKAPTLQAFCHKYLAQRPDLACRTRRSYDLTIKVLGAYFGPGRRLSDVTADESADWRSSLVGESSACQHTRNAKAIFEDARKREIIAVNPFQALQSTPPDPDKDWFYVDEPTLDRMLAACKNDDQRLLLAIARLAGLRHGEILRLKWEDVDLIERRLTVTNPRQKVTTKNRRRVLPIVGKLHDLLFKAYLLGDAREYVVELPTTSIGRLLKPVFERAGVAMYHKPLHTLRKNRQTDWERNHRASFVSDWMGNSPGVARKHYVKAEEQDYEAAIKGD